MGFQPIVFEFNSGTGNGGTVFRIRNPALYIILGKHGRNAAQKYSKDYCNFSHKSLFIFLNNTG
jgi:hypothetical protein